MSDVYTYTGSVSLGSRRGCYWRRTPFSDGSEMRSRLRVSPLDDRDINILLRCFSVESKAGNDRPLPKYEIILTLLDQEGREQDLSIKHGLGAAFLARIFTWMSRQ